MSTFRILFLYFIIYSFLGWIIEGIYHLITKSSFIKPNFLMLPLKPMYGAGAVLLICTKATFPFWLFLVSLLVIPSAVEYLTALLLDYFFKLKYWDYSQMPYHLSGYICLKFSLYWVFLGLILVYLIHPFIMIFSNIISWFWFYFFPIMFLILLIDFCLSSRAHRSKISKT